MESLTAHAEHCKVVWDVVCFAALCGKCSGEHYEMSQFPLALTHRPSRCVIPAASVTIQTGKAAAMQPEAGTCASLCPSACCFFEWANSLCPLMDKLHKQATPVGVLLWIATPPLGNYLVITSGTIIIILRKVVKYPQVQKYFLKTLTVKLLK